MQRIYKKYIDRCCDCPHFFHFGGLQPACDKTDDLVANPLDNGCIPEWCPLPIFYADGEGER